jgi:YD repeat-containing protein
VEYGQVTGSENGTFTDSGTDKFTTTITYAASTTLNLVGLPSQETVVNNASTTVSDTKFYYDSLALGSVAKGNLTKRELWKSGASWIDIEKTYNAYGLVTEEKDPRDKATTYTYDTHNLHVATSTNAKSQSTGFVYDYSIGKPKRTNDPNGLIFEVTYDALDRITAEKQPDQTTPSTLVTKTAYAYTDTVGSRKVQEIRHLSSATSTDRYIYLDGLDRPIQERTEAEGSNFSVKDYEYNEIGKIERESLPYFSSGSSRTSATTNGALVASMAYDPMVRVNSIGTAVGTTTHTRVVPQ